MVSLNGVYEISINSKEAKKDICAVCCKSSGIYFRTYSIALLNYSTDLSSENVSNNRPPSLYNRTTDCLIPIQTRRTCLWFYAKLTNRYTSAAVEASRRRAYLCNVSENASKTSTKY